MITSKLINQEHAFVWIYLPEQIKPVVAGRITKENQIYYFTYGQSYLENVHAIALSPLELPLKQGNFYPEGLNNIHSCLRDAAPDAWGRRLIDYTYARQENDELDYFLLSGSNRIGALDFQLSSKEYIPRDHKSTTMEELLQITNLIESEKPIPPKLEFALLRGTSVGGARPKALIQHNGAEYIAKFGLTHDTFNIIKAEYVGMSLAKLSGIKVPEIKLQKILGKDIYFVKRFDRNNSSSGITRRLMLSALSLLELNEMEARYARYIDLADIIRQRFKNPRNELLELYKRLAFNVLIGNTDDHARNHSAFWDGKDLCLTPAYDLCPQPRVGQEATQAMSIDGKEGNLSTLINVLSISSHFQLTEDNARKIIDEMIYKIKKNWQNVSTEANLSEVDRKWIWERAILNPFIFRGW